MADVDFTNCHELAIDFVTPICCTSSDGIIVFEIKKNTSKQKNTTFQNDDFQKC